MAALTKAQIVDGLVDEGGFSKREAKELTECLFELLVRALENGETVKLPGLGNLQLREKRGRPGRNPKTGQDIPIAPRRVVTFHASQKLRKKVAGYVDPASED